MHGDSLEYYYFDISYIQISTYVPLKTLMKKELNNIRRFEIETS
jgi:hypothetical protein